MSAMTAAAQHYFSELAGLEAARAGRDPAWLGAARRQALIAFGQTGFPAAREEEWRYTSCAPIERRRFRLARGDGLDPARLDPHRIEGSLELVFVNGQSSRRLSRLEGLPRGMHLTALSEGVEHEGLRDSILRHAAEPASPFVALNSGLLSDGAYLRVEGGVRCERPIHLVFISTEGEGPICSFPRVLIELGRGAEARVVERYLGLGGGEYLTDTLTEVVLDEGAAVEHVRLQLEGDGGFHVGRLSLQQSRHSHAVSHSLSFGARLARVDIEAWLDAEGAEVRLNGLYCAAGNQHCDHHTRIDHLSPHTTSDELYKGVIGGRGRAVFNGKVVVHPAAQKSAAQQTNKNLLLSEHAEVDTKPELQIHADDVKCSHGATVGQLDLEALYYLRARGIGLEAGRTLLTYAFAEEVIRGIGVPAVRAEVARHMAGALGPMGGEPAGVS